MQRFMLMAAILGTLGIAISVAEVANAASVV